MELNKPTTLNYAKYLGMHLFLYGLKDVLIVYHSPAGCKKKSEFTLSPNDISFNENHYFDNYINNAESIFWTEDSLIQALRDILLKELYKTIYIITTDVPEIIGFDFFQVKSEIEQEFFDIELIYLKWQAIGGDMYEWYREALETTLSTRKNNASIENEKLANGINFFWYFFHRFEWDFYGDVKEIQQICSDIWVTLNTFFPWVSSYNDLSRISWVSRSIIFSPYNTQNIQEILTTQYQQEVVSCPLPIGISRTLSFIRALSSDTKRVEDYISERLGDVIPKIHQMMPIFLGKKFALVGDSQRLLWLLDLFLDVWMIPCYLVCTDTSITDISSEVFSICKLHNFSEKIEIFSREGNAQLSKIINDSWFEIDILVGSSVEKNLLTWKTPFYEFFFPLMTRHFINKYSSLGFEGVLNIMTDIYNLLNRLEYYNLSNSLASLMGDATFYHKV